jgi:hypothetical protein
MGCFFALVQEIKDSNQSALSGVWVSFFKTLAKLTSGLEFSLAKTENNWSIM